MSPSATTSSSSRRRPLDPPSSATETIGGDRSAVLAHRPQRDRGAVTAADRDDRGRARRGRPLPAHRSMSRWKTLRRRRRRPGDPAAPRPARPSGVAPRCSRRRWSGRTSPRARTPARARARRSTTLSRKPGSRVGRARTRAPGSSSPLRGRSSRPSRGWAGSGSRRRGRRRAGCRACSRTTRSRSASTGCRARRRTARRIRARSWLTLSSPVSITTSASARSGSSSRRSSAIDSSTPAGGQGVAPPGALEPADQDVVGGVEEQDPDPVPGPGAGCRGSGGTSSRARRRPGR